MVSRSLPRGITRCSYPLPDPHDPRRLRTTSQVVPEGAGEGCASAVYPSGAWWVIRSAVDRVGAVQHAPVEEMPNLEDLGLGLVSDSGTI